MIRSMMASQLQRKVCVDFGNSTRVVQFESASAYDDLSEVSKAIRSTFKLDQNTKRIVQVKMIRIGKGGGLMS